MPRLIFTFADVVHPLALGSMQICTVTRFPPYAAAFWLPVLLFEIFLFVLAFRIAWYNHRQLGNWRGARLLHVVLRDNFSFFFVYVIVISTVSFPLIVPFSVFIAYLLTAVVWLVAGPQYFLIPAMLSCSFTTIMGCRFILNLFQAYHKPRGIIAESARSRPAWPPLVICGSDFVELPALETKHPRTAAVQTDETAAD